MLELRLPDGIVAKGGIPASQAPEDLVADMLEVPLPDGTTIDVGWLPEHDPSGRYRVVVFRRYWQNQAVQPTFFACPQDVVRAVEEIARRSVRHTQEPGR